MGGLPFSREVIATADRRAAIGQVRLVHEDRVLRRKVLETADGLQFLVDLPQVRRVAQGHCFVLTGGRLVEVIAADEPLIEVRAPDLARIAWHIGNRHAACQVEPDHLLIRNDHVLRAMLVGLGAQVRDVMGPFCPEAGAYDHGGGAGPAAAAAYPQAGGGHHGH